MTASNQGCWRLGGGVMDDQQRLRVDSLLDEALSQSESERAAFLASISGDDEVRREVLSLVRCHERAGSFLVTPTLTVRAAHDERHRSTFAGGDRLLGRFEIVGMLARGGMGEVYEALDERLQERVALKT